MKKRDLSKLAAMGLLMAAANIEAGVQDSSSNKAAHTYLAAKCGAGSCGGEPQPRSYSSNQKAAQPSNSRWNGSDNGQVADMGCGAPSRPQSTYYYDNSQPTYSQPSSNGCANKPQQPAGYYNTQPTYSQPSSNGCANKPQQPAGYYNTQPANYNTQPASQPTAGCGAPSRPSNADQGNVSWNNASNNNNAWRTADAAAPSAAQSQRNYGMSQGSYAKSTDSQPASMMMSEQDFIKQLYEDGKKAYMSMTQEGKAAARQMASQGKDANTAVKDAQKKMQQQRSSY